MIGLFEGVEVSEGAGSDGASAGCALDEAFAKEEGFDFVFECISG